MGRRALVRRLRRRPDDRHLARFDAFCESEGLDPESVRELFRDDARGAGLLRGLEPGELADAEFERDFGALLGSRPDGLIDRLFAGLAPTRR